MPPVPMFVTVTDRPATPDGTVLILLHGTGGDEHDLLPLGRQVAPHALLVGIRGRSTTEPARRWFRRTSPTTFDQEDLRREVADFAAFVPGLLDTVEADPSRTALLGYSNGANFIGAFMLLHPGIVKLGALLRPMMVLEAPPMTDLTGHQLLLVAGKYDPYGGPYLDNLHVALTEHGASVAVEALGGGHELSRDDIPVVQDWLKTHLK